MTFRSLILATAAVAGLACSVGRAAAAEPTQAVLDNAHAMVIGTGNSKGNDKLVLAFCYPTAKSITSVTYVTKKAFNDGSFQLWYDYEYRDSDGDPQNFQLRFSFDAKAKLTDVRGTTKHSSFWPPFTTAGIALAVLKEAIRNDEKLKKDPLFKALLTVDSPTEFLVGIMNIKAGK
jgi:hypothetical protein